MDLYNVVIATAWQPGRVRDQMSAESWAARFGCAKRLVANVLAAGAQVVVVTDAFSHDALQGLGAVLEFRESNETGPMRRVAFARALECVDAAKPHAVIWTEPEKYALAASLPDITEPVLSGRADLVIPRRKSLQSYPTWQQPWELTGNSMCAKLLGIELDYFFGPRVMNRRALQKFLDYPGALPAPDLGDSVYAPLADCVASGLCLQEVAVDFSYPEEQRRAEESDLRILPRRTFVLDLIIRSLYERVMQLESRGLNS